ncbi:hypothetical protein SCUP515_09086 [Seiridium cupressi]
MSTKPTLAAVSAPSRLETLPSLVLDSICQYLAHCDSQRRSLFAFSLVNKQCCSIAAAQRFDRIKLEVRGTVELRQDIERWNSMLEVEGRARHVRKIKVVGYMPRRSRDERDRDPQLGEAEALAEEWRDEREYESFEDDFVDPPRRQILFNSSLRPLENGQAKHLHDESWQPLARFISTLPVLKDLVYSCLDQVPPCLLTSLHQHHPYSRLHVHTFSLRSLYQRKDNLHDIDPDEFMLATSPCLYAVALLSSPGYDTYGHVDYNHEALLAMVSGMAPGLRHVRVYKSTPGSSPELLEATRTSRPLWRGFFIDKETPEQPPAPLESLVLDGEDHITSETLTEWNQHIDLSKLGSLKIPAAVNLDVLPTLVHMAAGGKFGSLHKLSLEVHSIDPQGYSRLDAEISQLFENIQSLAELEIAGYYGPKSFSAIMQHHGRSLYRLCLTSSSKHAQETITSLTKVEVIQQYCSNLRDLSLAIPRTKGDEQEVAIYHTLGKFRHLRRLSLLLECSNQRWDELGADSPPTDLVRDIFVNTAVDRSLARSIFHVISTADPSAPSPLELLRLSVDASTFIDVWNDYDFRNIICWIGRSWLCQRPPRDDHRGEITAHEIQTQHRQQYKEFMDENWELSFGHGLVYEKVWKELWPETTGNWMNDWRSFPLAGVLFNETK